jgi:predicted MPP superfamily phosphohydrolase
VAERVSCRRRRRSFALALLGAAAAVLAYAGLIEPRWVALTRHVLGTPRPGERPLRVVQLSDLHLRGIGMRERRVAALTRGERPDLVVLTGDVVETADALGALDEFLALVGERARPLAIRGNWEHWGNVPPGELAAVLERRGGRLLLDESALGEHGGRTWAIIGLDWPTGRLRDGDPALAPAVNRLVLLHAPAGRDGWAGPPAAAMLSGHTHGGQVALAGFAPLLPPGSGPYLAGWYRGAPVDLYVSRGVGTSVVPLRLGARPEVASFEWWLE